MSAGQTDIFARDILDLNLMYWRSVREMGLSNPAEAALRLGLPRALVDQVIELSLSEIRDLATASLLQFRVHKVDQTAIVSCDDPDNRLRQLARSIR